MAETVTAPPVALPPSKTATKVAEAIVEKTSGKQPPASITPDPNAGKIKHTVEGKDVWLTPEQEKAYIDKGLAYEPKVSQLARLQQEVRQFQDALINDPGKVIANIAKQSNVPIRTMVERVLASNVNDETKETVGSWYYENVVKRSKMTDEQRENLELKEWKAKQEEQSKKYNEEALAKDNMARAQAAERMLKGQLAEALKEVTVVKNLDTPLGVMVAKRIFDVMRLSYQTKNPITPKAAAEKVQAELRQLHKLHLDEKSEDEIIEEIGKENAEKVRKYFLKIVKAAEKDQKNGAEGGKRPASRGERQTMTPDEFREYLEERKRNG